tara:strand:- start:259 stop:417 length:159 start_codon:yes stop_codon:yes gene_type:complete
MLVKELIKELKKYPNDFTVQINKGISVDILKVERDMNEENYRYVDIIGETNE